MAKIYEALRRGRGEMSELLPQVLEESVEWQPAAPENDDHAAVQAVLGDAGIVSPGVPAAAPAAVLAPAPGRREAVRLARKAPLLPFDNSDRRAAEQYRIIRTRLFQHPKQPRLLLISSAGPADGKSTTAVNLAGALSLKGEASVLLADIDFRRSTIHTQLGLPVTPGLADVLSGTATLEEALVQVEQLPNLYVITAGSPHPNPSELLDSTRWTAIRDELRSLFRYVIADSPPVASVADYELLQASCDGVVLVVRPDHTKRQACLKALEIIPKDKLIGAVMNCVDDWFLTRRTSYSPSAYYYGRNAG